MLTPATVQHQYELISQDEPRILIVGAGIAGIALAQLLRKYGRHPVLIERAEDLRQAGYMLALMPMADPVFEDLGIQAEYRAASVPFARYTVHGRTGRTLRQDSLAGILARHGDYRGISRGELLDVLTIGGGAVSYGTTVEKVTDRPGPGVVVRLTDGVELAFDLVVVADGLHSRTRELIPAGRPAEVVTTSWGGWVYWIPADADADLGEEVWGAGFFLGMYPVKDRIGVFLGGDRADTAAGSEAFADRVRAALRSGSSPRIDRALDLVAGSSERYYWPLDDCRSPVWAGDSTILLGDAAAGFLPTAGVGAGMAMESAWVLAGMLRDTGPGPVGAVVRRYEEVQRPRVEAAQDNSRQLARMMFHRSRSLAVVRDLALRVVTVSVALRPIQRLLATRPGR